jgi:hypothetical protein
MSKEQKQALIDAFAERFISRKLLAWLTATGLMLAGTGLTSSDWVIITTTYIGTQAVVDAVARLRGLK